MARGGGFGSTSLDPFGGGGGDLSRYNLGTSVTSIEEYELYATQVGWQNGTVTDAAYLAKLKESIALTNPGTSDNVRAQDRYDDALYNIERNKLVRAVNEAPSSSAKIAAEKALIAREGARQAQMTPDNEQYRELTDRITSERADIRSTTYADAVKALNAGKTTTQRVLEIAQRLAAEAKGAPDADQWSQTVTELVDRRNDEVLADKIQGFQHHRVSGDQLLHYLDGRISGLQPGSPRWQELTRQREDLRQTLKDQRSARDYAVATGKHERGQMSDTGYLGVLHKQLTEATPGTAEAADAKNRLLAATFSLNEDRLRFDVSEGKKGSVPRLVAFYRSYQSTMVRSSAEWRQVQLAIDTLNGGGGRGGGGRRKKGKSDNSKGLFGGLSIPKVLPKGYDLAGLVARGEAPKDLLALFAGKVNNKAWAKFFDNNRRSALHANQQGDSTWTFYDLSGKPHELPYRSHLLEELDHLNVDNMWGLVASAKSPLARQRAIGKAITAMNQLQSHGGTITMDKYGSQMSELNREKQRALAGGRFDDYIAITFTQQDLLRSVLGIEPGQPTTVANATNPFLTNDMRDRLSRDLDKLEPTVGDPASEDYHPTGDDVLAAVRDGAIAPDGNLDPSQAFVTQLPDGSFKLTLLDQTDFVPDAQGNPRPAYTVSPAEGGSFVRATVDIGGEIATVYQPVVPGAITVPIRQYVPGPKEADSYGTSGPAGGVVDVPGKEGPASSMLRGGMAVTGFYTVENGKQVWWATVDGVTYVKVKPGQPLPQLLIGREGAAAGVTYDKATGAFMVNGKPISSAAEIAPYLRFVGLRPQTDASGRVVTANGTIVYTNEAQGVPSDNGIEYRTIGADGRLDTRASYVIERDAVAQRPMLARFGEGPYNPNFRMSAAVSDELETRDKEEATRATLARVGEIPGLRPAHPGRPGPDYTLARAGRDMDKLESLQPPATSGSAGTYHVPIPKIAPGAKADLVIAPLAKPKITAARPDTDLSKIAAQAAAAAAAAAGKRRAAEEARRRKDAQAAARARAAAAAAKAGASLGASAPPPVPLPTSGSNSRAV